MDSRLGNLAMFLSLIMYHLCQCCWISDSLSRLGLDVNMCSFTAAVVGPLGFCSKEFCRLSITVSLISFY